MEESYALGVLGASGRGACEAAGLQPGQVEVIVASMGTTLASVGGFCVGHHEVGYWEGRPLLQPTVLLVALRAQLQCCCPQPFAVDPLIAGGFGTYLLIVGFTFCWAVGLGLCWQEQRPAADYA